MSSLGLRTKKKDAEAFKDAVLSAVSEKVSEMFRAACFRIEQRNGPRGFVTADREKAVSSQQGH